MRKLTVIIAFASLVASCVAVSRTNVSTRTWQLPPGTVHIFRFSPTDQHAAFILQEPQSPAGIHRLIVVAPNTGKVLLDENGYFAGNFCFDLSGRRIAVHWLDRVRIYTLPDGSCIQSIETSKRTALFNCMGFTDDGSVLAIANKKSPSDYEAWNVSTAKLVSTHGKISYWAGSEIAADFSKSLSPAGWVTPGPSVVDINLGRRITHCVRLPHHIYATFTRDSLEMLTVHKDGAILLWELRDTVQDATSLLPSQNATILASRVEAGIETAVAFAILHKTDKLGFISADRTLRYTDLPLADSIDKLGKVFDDDSTIALN